ncbi:MAG: acetate--CoA ligase family protein [Deltaproteobacteria bacterium]|nr:acetate--CoA ligase family protein [Deltaproteobacteria bacterium]
MNFFFEPEVIAVVGATPDITKGGYAILKNLLTSFEGKICPINPRYKEIEGLTSYSHVSDVSGPVDLAIIMVPAPMVPDVLEDCVAKGVPGAIITSGGFAEIGGEGRKLQEHIKNISKNKGIRLWGPNCMGLVDGVKNHNFSLVDPTAMAEGFTPGSVSLIVQSGMLSASFLIDVMSHGIMGISKVCSIGNKVDVDECDLLEYFLEDRDTRVIGLYVEALPDGRRFVNLARGGEKPVVILKGGKSKKGAEAALSHTASLAGNNRVISGALAQAGIIEAKDFKQLMDLCRTLAAFPPPQRPEKTGRTAILFVSGGAGIVATDFMEEMDLPIAKFSHETIEVFQSLYPTWMPVDNPADLFPAIQVHGSDKVFKEATEAVLKDPGVDAILLQSFAGYRRFKYDPLMIADLAKGSDKPILFWLLGKMDDAFEFQQQAHSYGFPVFRELYRTTECLAALFKWRKAPELISETRRAETETFLLEEWKDILTHFEGSLDEHLSKSIISQYGIPTVGEIVTRDINEADKAFRQIGFPLVLKGLAPGSIHKTEHGLVHLNINNVHDARSIFDSLMNTMKGNGEVLIQKYIPESLEIIIGFIRDPQFGPCVMCGLGGIMAEVFGDVAFAIAPLTQYDALNCINRLQGQKLLDGFRGTPPVDRDNLARLLIALGEIGCTHERIKEIDINPLIVRGKEATAVDATIILGD